MHNLTGRAPDGSCKHRSGALPNRVKIEGYWTLNEHNLYADGNDLTANQPLYWIHPSGPETDVGILPLGFGAKIKACLDESFFDESQNAGSVKLYAMQLCHIVGFPEGLVDRSDPKEPLPVYKSGYIASEPETDFQGKAIILIDAVTRPGQSGSPVFVGATATAFVPNGGCARRFTATVAALLNRLGPTLSRTSQHRPATFYLTYHDFQVVFAIRFVT